MRIKERRGCFSHSAPKKIFLLENKFDFGETNEDVFQDFLAFWIRLVFRERFSSDGEGVAGAKKFFFHKKV